MVAPAVESRIDAVTVFRRGARVTRVAEIQPENGMLPPAVRIPGLPLAADDASFRVRVEGAGNGGASSGLPVARDLRVALEVPDRVADEKPPDERALDEARLEVAHLEARMAQAERDLKRLEALPFTPRPSGKKGKAPPDSPTEARLALLDFRSESSERLAEELLEVRDKAREAGERRKELEDRVRRASSDRVLQPHTLRKTAVVQLGRDDDEAPAAPARLLIDYTVPGARWAPSYAVRLMPDGSEAQIAMRAVVAQRSGEDWSGVRLTLATARLERWAELPELPSLRIGRRQPVAAPLGWRPPPTGVEGLYRDWDQAFAGRLHEEKAPGLRVRAEDAVAEPAMAEFEDAGGAEETAEDGAAIEIAAALDALDEPEESSDLELGTMDMGADFKAPPGAVPPPVAMAAAAGPTKAPAPAGVRLASVMKDRSREARSRGGRLEIATAESTLRARDDMLAYGNLRMPPARSAERGHLVVTDRLHLYLELFVEREIEVRFDVAQAVTRANRRADGAGQTLPTRHHLAASDDGFDYAYVAETPADIPSDRHYHSIPLVTRTAPAGLRHVAVPRESTDVFRVTRFENPLPGPLLPGPADVSLGDEFLVTTDVAATPAGAAVTLGLGVDQAVKVSRNTHFREETKGLTRGSLALAHQIAIGVQSHAPHPIQLEVRERIPTTQKDEKEIEVELGEVTPDWQPWEPEAEAGGTRLEGGHRWLVSLAAGEKKELRAAYRVRISSKHELVGGNRRERG